MQHELPPRPVGRPTKLTTAFLQSAQHVLFEDKATIIYTNAELLDAINESLPSDEQISPRTFESWKARAMRGEEPTAGFIEDQFLQFYKKTLREQKKAIIIAFSTDMQWQRWAWILERKFTEWNLKHLSQVDHTTGREPLNQLSDAVLDAKIQ
ncbi:hypothetical protein [Hymenobacter wooponensis]|uniref:Uncharacterized protein n=1 Tax=Hymenobacter wooponensis TaxID=1525360 RepID=A0A4Z0MND2_9BACT|nr:hypothetical protein [Hymenobacter wooponensis]TGD80818.1 hypothetical protein EU557_13525 [Hymenobacter wooponensis]